MSMVRVVVGGVDTHADVHVVAAIDGNGGVLGIEAFPADAAGYWDLLHWLVNFGEVSLVGVEGTGSYGVGLDARLGSRSVQLGPSAHRCVRFAWSIVVRSRATAEPYGRAEFSLPDGDGCSLINRDGVYGVISLA